MINFGTRGAEPDEAGLALLRQFVHKQLLTTIENGDTSIFSDPKGLKQRVDILVRDVTSRRSQPISRETRERLRQEVLDEIAGLGPIASLMAAPEISDILVNGPDEVWVDRNGRLIKTPIRFDDESHLRRILDRLVAAQGKHLDATSPIVDARLPDGSRLHAVIPPLCAKGPIISIRRFRTQVISESELIQQGFMSVAMLSFLRMAIQMRINIIIAGGAAAGKTTLLNILSRYIPQDERIVTVEETAELKLEHPHVVPLEGRTANIEGRGSVSLRDLVRAALRMRADRIIVGEVRGVEAFDMLQAMNVGHDGSLTTVHANSPVDVLRRLESLVMMNDIDIPRDAVREMVGSAIQLIVHVNRYRDGQRRVTSMIEVLHENSVVQTRELFQFNANRLDTNGRVHGEHVQVNQAHFVNEKQRLGYLQPTDQHLARA